eukprot:7046970-Alexandrium_andersonii.AAC.1
METGGSGEAGRTGAGGERAGVRERPRPRGVLAGDEGAERSQSGNSSSEEVGEWARDEPRPEPGRGWVAGMPSTASCVWTCGK